MKNISRTVRLLNVEYPVKTGNGFETRNDTVVDMGAAAIRAELKKRCVEGNVKFLGEYDVISVDEHRFSMSVETFTRFAEKID
jgi:hypothetical protein